jgi:hypothetical protein
VWRAAAKLLPRKRQYATMYDALQLGRCNVTAPRPPSIPDWEPPAAALPAPALVIVADAQHGHDGTGTGSLLAPLQSLQAALSAVRNRIMNMIY